ncbi:GAF domain-containing protein [Desulfosporosinus youngiae]|uniref:GAF domain-containing protein n=1 Tax=Desulfosporosinus youngiae DSM 17734 TaxID=768710 RepID=H5Y3D6_9FIRM|nr:GAF domain-containing protein [Desulfosporosinus youngiae]EHQ88905.1 GAF domain-containing protein [Desulfosporosinus youngiae DSM 17734]
MEKQENNLNYQEFTFALSRIAIALTSETDLNNLFQLIVSEMLEIANCDACSLFLREYEPDRLVFQATRTLSLEKKQSQHLSTFKAKPVSLEKQSIAGFTALTGRTVNIADCYALSEKEEFKFNSSYDKATHYQTISMLVVPMKLQDGTIVGVIQLINKFDGNNKIVPFPKQLEEVISAVASQAAVAIHNSRLKCIQSESSFTFVALVLSLCVYTFFLGVIDPEANDNSYTIVTLLICLYFIVISIALIRRSELPISKFGLSFKNLKPSLIESGVVTVIILILITLLKIEAIKSWAVFQGYPVIDFGLIDWAFYLYLLIAPFQEFIARGVIQGTVERIMPGKYNSLWAIVVASMLFSVSHVFYSFELAMLTSVSGFLWGYLYMRHRTIIGISISHFLIGNYLVLTHFWSIII